MIQVSTKCHVKLTTVPVFLKRINNTVPTHISVVIHIHYMPNVDAFSLL